MVSDGSGGVVLIGKAPHSKCGGRKPLGVRVPPPPPVVSFARTASGPCRERTPFSYIDTCKTGCRHVTSSAPRGAGAAVAVSGADGPAEPLTLVPPPPSPERAGRRSGSSPRGTRPRTPPAPSPSAALGSAPGTAGPCAPRAASATTRRGRSYPSRRRLLWAVPPPFRSYRSIAFTPALNGLAQEPRLSHNAVSNLHLPQPPLPPFPIRHARVEEPPEGGPVVRHPQVTELVHQEVVDRRPAQSAASPRSCS